MKSHRGIGHDRFGTSGCDFQKTTRLFYDLVSNEIEISFLRLGNELLIRERSLRSRIPVDHSAPAIDQASLIKIDKSFFDGGGISVVERVPLRSEEHTSELQSRVDLVCRLLLEKK